LSPQSPAATPMPTPCLRLCLGISPTLAITLFYF
jgi:hypothetical protein